MKNHLLEIKACNCLEIDRMINEGLGAGIIANRYDFDKLSIQHL